MRFNATPEEVRLEQIVNPYLRVCFDPFGCELSDDAPDEVKSAYVKLQKLTAEHIKSCQDP